MSDTVLVQPQSSHIRHYCMDHEWAVLLNYALIPKKWKDCCFEPLNLGWFVIQQQVVEVSSSVEVRGHPDSISVALESKTEIRMFRRPCIWEEHGIWRLSLNFLGLPLTNRGLGPCWIALHVWKCKQFYLLEYHFPIQLSTVMESLLQWWNHSVSEMTNTEAISHTRSWGNWKEENPNWCALSV